MLTVCIEERTICQLLLTVRNNVLTAQDMATVSTNRGPANVAVRQYWTWLAGEEGILNPSSTDKEESGI